MAQRGLAQWMLDLSPLVAHADDGELSLEVPPPLADQFDGAESIKLSWDADQDEQWSAAGDGRLFHWLREHLREHPPNVSPANQVESLHPLTTVLFDVFQLEQGTLQLGGCTMEDRPVLRRTWLDSEGMPRHQFFFEDGQRLADELAAELGLHDLAPLSSLQTPPMDQAAVAKWSARAAVDEPVVLDTVVWCKHATGELTAVGEAGRLQLPFSGWAAQLLSGAVKPPPYREQRTGDESYELVRLDDGSLTASAAAEACSVSGKIVIRTELRTCAASKRRALKQFFVTCPVSQDQVLEEELRACSQCCQPVGPHCRDERKICAACREMKPAGPADPRLSRILGEHPGLGPWRRWRIAETNEVYLLGAAALFRKLLLVLDKETLAPRHVAVRSRFSRVWTTPSDLEQQELLRG